MKIRLSFFPGPNFYTYVWNRPIAYTDPSGNNPGVGVLAWGSTVEISVARQVVAADLTGWMIGRGIRNILTCSPLSEQR